MPSGAKKRKAARKKKEMEAHLKESTEDPQGTDEAKSQDEKDCDTGGSNSPVHQENHDYEHHFSEGIEGLKERDPSSIASLPAEKNSTGGVVNGGYEEEMVSKVKESYVDKDATSQNVEHVKESNDGNGEYSNLKQVDDSHMSGKHLQGEASIVISSVEPVVPSSELSSKVTDKHLQEETTIVISSVEPVVLSSALSSEVTDKHLQEEPSNSVSEALQYDNSVKIDYSTHILVPDAIQSSTTSSIVISSFEPVVPSSELSSAVTDNIPVEKPVVKPKRIEDNIYGNVKGATSEVKQKPKGYVREELPSSHVPITEMSNGDEHGKESGIPECSENQPLLASAPQVVQRTSWLSCCGLFEVLSGSDK